MLVWYLNGRVSKILGRFLLVTGNRDVNWNVVKTNLKEIAWSGFLSFVPWTLA